LVTDDLNEETRLVLQDQWTDNAGENSPTVLSLTELIFLSEWHSLNLKTTILEVVARISSRVFLGTEVCRNPAWLRITIDYTVNIFMAVQALKKWPKILQPYVWRFVPEVTKVRAQKDEARRIIQPVVDKRIADNWAVSGDSSKKKTTYSDAVRWVHEIANGRPYDAAIIQLGFSMAAIHTTTDLLTQVLYDLCKHLELIEPLREELVTVLKEDGLQRTSLYKLKLMDSVVKESQRLKPTNIRRWKSSC
jgi:cytochrome P450